MSADVLVLCSDLFFPSQIKGAAGPAEISVRVCDDAASVLEVVDASVRLLLVDLTSPHLDCAALIQALPEPRPYVLGFYPHVQKELLETAQQAGFDEVLTRGVFSSQLADVLQRG